MINFGLIGYGKIGERHAEHIIAHPEAKLHSVFDIKDDRLNLFRNRYRDIRTYDSLKGILSDPSIDIISICTPNATHAEIAIASEFAGKGCQGIIIMVTTKPNAILTCDGIACPPNTGTCPNNARILVNARRKSWV